MTMFEAVFLGLVQGATEFLPVSSSGHLVLVPWMLGIDEPGLTYSAILHWGTVLAVLVYFRADLVRIVVAGLKSIRTRSLDDPDARIGWWIVIGTIPAVVFGVFLKDGFERLFGNPRAVSLFLFFTAALLWTSERKAAQTRNAEDLPWFTALLIGLMQALAITPGISRSGATIAAGLEAGLKREEATRYSFLLGVPAVLGAGLLSLIDLLAAGIAAAQWPVLLAGFAAAAMSGYIAIRWLLEYVRKHSLKVFSVYCVLLGVGALLVSVLRG